MIWLLKPDQTEATEFAPAMDETTGILPGLAAVARKPVQVGFDGGRLTSDARISTNVSCLFWPVISQTAACPRGRNCRRKTAWSSRLKSAARPYGRLFRIWSTAASSRSGGASAFHHAAEDHAGADRADWFRRGHAGIGANPDRPPARQAHRGSRRSRRAAPCVAAARRPMGGSRRFL